MALTAAVAPLGCVQAFRHVNTIRSPRTWSNESICRKLVLLHGGASVETERHSGLKRNTTTWRCMPDPENKGIDPTSSHRCHIQEEVGEQIKEEPEAVEVASSSGASAAQVFEQIGPTKQTNRIIAFGSVLMAVGLFASGRLEGARPGLSQLVVNAVPYEEALANGRPTVVEFYANWCEVCREMAKDVYGVEMEYRDRINFVMLNVDNAKWEAELDEFGVEGIPHFAFLDRQGNEEGNIVGRLPATYLRENVVALVRGDASVPHSSIVGKFSRADNRQAPPVVSPRSHSQN